MAVAHSSADVAPAQPVVIRGAPTCSTCSIERQSIVRIGEADDELINGPVVVPVARDSRGRFFVIDQDDGPIKLFAHDGRFLSLLGRKGAGPGESMGPATVAVGVGDSVFVTDRRLIRGSVFGPELNFLRSFPLTMTAINSQSQVIDGLLVVNARANDAAGIGFSLFAYDATGRRAKQIGPDEPIVTASQTELAERVIGRAGNGKGGLLVAHRHRYQWWRLSKSLDPEAEFVREASWFRRYEPPNTQPLQMNGVSYMKAIWEDDAGRTWIAIGTIRIRFTGEGGRRERTESSRVEVLDVRNRRVLASVEFPENFVSGFSDGKVVFSEVRDDGRTVLSVIRLSLHDRADDGDT
jgi:hypothetical protein